MAIFVTRLDPPASLPSISVNDAAFSADGSRLAVAYDNSPYLKIYDTSDWSVIAGPASAPAGTVYGVSWSPDGSLLACAHLNSPYVTIYEAATWTKLANPSTLPAGHATSCQFNAAGTVLAVRGDGTPAVTLYDTSDWSKIADPTGIPSPARDCKFSNSGAHLAVISTYGQILWVYDTSDWSLLSGPASPPSTDARACAWSADDSALVVSDNSSPNFLIVYDASDWTRLSPPAQQPSALPVGLSFDRQGRVLACVGNIPMGMSLYSWPSLELQDPIAGLPEAHGRVAAFSPTGSTTAYGTVSSPYLELYSIYDDGAESVSLPWIIKTEDGLPWPVKVVIQTSWPVTLEQITHDIALPWPAKVAASWSAQSAWPVQMLSADVVGGLNGAGGWAASQDGTWRAVVVLDDDTDISDRISGEVSVQIADDAARTAQFSFLPAAPIQPMGLIGRRVRIAFSQPGGLNAQTIFRGVLDVPSISLHSGIIACQCHDQAQEIIAAMERERIDELVGGRWHVAVSGDPDDEFGYLTERIQSVGASWALDTDQSLRIVPWRGLPRSVTVKRADVLSDSLAIDLPSRDQVRTRINVRFQYRYPVHRARGVVAQYAQPLSFFAPSAGAAPKPSYLFLTVAMVEGAAERPQGWSLRNLSIDHPAAGTYQLGPSITDGFYIINPRVARDLALGFTAHYSTRWQQTVTEDYQLTVRWAALETTLGGPVEEQIGATLESRFESPDWSSDETVEPILDVPQVGDVATPYRAPGADVADAQDALRTLLDRAWVKLWAASRTGRVRFALPCRPDLWLDTWATLDDPDLLAAGKVTEVTHTLNMETGEAVTALAVAVGLPGDETASLPAWTLPASPYATAEPDIDELSAEIGTYVGGLETSPPYDDEIMIGFLTNAEGQTYESRNYYPHELSIGWPAIDADDRDPAEAVVEEVIDVDIPTDQLEISP